MTPIQEAAWDASDDARIADKRGAMWAARCASKLLRSPQASREIARVAARVSLLESHPALTGDQPHQEYRWQLNQVLEAIYA